MMLCDSSNVICRMSEKTDSGKKNLNFTWSEDKIFRGE